MFIIRRSKWLLIVRAKSLEQFQQFCESQYNPHIEATKFSSIPSPKRIWSFGGEKAVESDGGNFGGQ